MRRYTEDKANLSANSGSLKHGPEFPTRKGERGRTVHVAAQGSSLAIDDCVCWQNRKVNNVLDLDLPGTGDEGVLELSWELFGELCRVLAIRVVRDYDPEIIVGIAAAGVIPGAVISAMLQREFYAIKITRRESDDGVRQRPEVLSAAPPQLAGRRVLLVDEVCDSGETMRLALAAVRDVGPSEVRTATSLVHQGGYQPDYFALSTAGIVIFPWDREVVESGRLVNNPDYEDDLKE